jgi:hypothetical protein
MARWDARCAAHPLEDDLLDVADGHVGAETDLDDE